MFRFSFLISCGILEKLFLKTPSPVCTYFSSGKPCHIISSRHSLIRHFFSVCNYKFKNLKNNTCTEQNYIVHKLFIRNKLRNCFTCHDSNCPKIIIIILSDPVTQQLPDIPLTFLQNPPKMNSSRRIPSLWDNSEDFINYRNFPKPP